MHQANGTEVSGTGSGLWATVNSGLFGIIITLILFGIGTVITVVLDRRGKPRPRLRVAGVDSVLVGPRQEGVSDRLEIRFDQTVVPRLTTTSFGLWNDGTTIIRGSDVVAADPLRLIVEKPGVILEATIESTSREWNDVRIASALEPNEAVISFDYLDPGDGFRARLIHSGPLRSVRAEGTIRGLPSGLTRYPVKKRVPPSVVTMWSARALALLVVLLLFAIGWSLPLIGKLIEASVVVAIIAVGALSAWWESRAKPRQVKGVPAAVTEDSLLYWRIRSG